MKNQRPKYLFIGITALICIILFGLGGYYFLKQNLSSPSPVTTTAETINNWKTYSFQGGLFKYPLDWNESPVLTRGSGFTQEIKDKDELYTLTFSTQGNYSQITGKPYVNIDEFINMPYKVKVVTIDGVEGRQGLPRAGSENINSVNFFSKDLKFIYILSLKTGDTTLNTSEVEVVKGQKLFDQILSTFKFIDQAVDETSNWKTYRNEKYGLSLQYPADWAQESTPFEGYSNPNRTRGFRDECLINYSEGYSIKKSINTKWGSLDANFFLAISVTNPENWTLEQWIKNCKRATPEEGVELKTLEINDKKIILYSFEGKPGNGGMASRYTYFIENSRKFYVFEFLNHFDNNSRKTEENLLKTISFK